MKTSLYRRARGFAWAFFLTVFISASLVIQLTPPTSARAQAPTCTRPHTDVATPLTDLGNQTYTRLGGQATTLRGGLYPNGSNVRPAAHETAGVTIARQIRPLDANGAPNSQTGKIGFISIGMSNTSSEFRHFIDDAVRDPSYNPRIEMTNGAIAGRTSRAWTDPNSDSWTILADRLAHEGLAPLQVQIAWIKLTQTNSGEFPTKAESLESELRIIVRNLKAKYPNVKIAYMSSRTRSYLTWSGLSPEPDAYETGFAVKWMIEGQINGDADLNYNPARGPVVAPFLSWGPYLWIDGENPRSDGRRWLATDLAEDCVHPSDSGVHKVVDMLMEFFKTDSTTTWFRNSTAPEIDLKFFLPFMTR